MRHLSGVCHADGSWRRVDRTGRAAVADVVEIVVSAIDRFWAELQKPLRFPRERTGFRKFSAALVRRKFADIARYHECAARGAKPVLRGFSDDGANRPV
jgi:hypothetical protein